MTVEELPEEDRAFLRQRHPRLLALLHHRPELERRIRVLLPQLKDYQATKDSVKRAGEEGTVTHWLPTGRRVA